MVTTNSGLLFFFSCFLLDSKQSFCLVGHLFFQILGRYYGYDFSHASRCYFIGVVGENEVPLAVIDVLAQWRKRKIAYWLKVGIVH